MEEHLHSSANIVMTTIRPLEIAVNEKEPSVWVSAGVTIWDFVHYLANYVTPVAPRGALSSKAVHSIQGVLPQDTLS